MLHYLFKTYLTVLVLLLLASCLNAQVRAKVKKMDDGPGFNRSVKSLEFSKDKKGNDILKINIDLIVNDKSDKKTNMNFDVIVLKNGKRINKIKQNALKGGAITCAVTCAGNCPSIFGDGVCGGCSCSYNNWLTSAIGESKEGDVFEVKLVNSRRGKKDKISRDDTKKVTYKSKVSRRLN